MFSPSTLPAMSACQWCQFNARGNIGSGCHGGVLPLKRLAKKSVRSMKFGVGCSKDARVSKEQAQVADFYHGLVAKNVEVHLVHKKGPHVLAAADAYAQGQNVGIGGLVDATGMCPASIFRFCVATQAAKVPDWFVQEHLS